MYLFFDTETTGLNKSSDRVVQIAWLLISKSGQELRRQNRLIKPSGFAIPPTAEKIHGISTVVANRFGVPLREALLDFAKDVDKSKVIIGHNLSFDIAMLRPEFSRESIEFRLDEKDMICTMRSSTAWCRLPKLDGRSGFKWPKLDELYYRLFGRYFEGAHDALADVVATKEVYFELRNLNIIHEPTRQPLQGVGQKIDAVKSKENISAVPPKQEWHSRSKQNYSKVKNAPQKATERKKQKDIQFVLDKNRPQLQFRTVASAEMHCNNCGETFSVTLRRYENASVCPRCFFRVSTNISW